MRGVILFGTFGLHAHPDQEAKRGVMIVVAEGADGVGKTTLMDALEARHPGPVHRINHGPPSDDEPAREYFNSVMEMVGHSRAGRLVLCDRLHVGELAYGPLLRSGSRVSLDEAWVIDEMLRGAGAMLVHCLLRGNELSKRLVMRDGGKPDGRSGASMVHSRPLRALYRRLIGQGVGVLPGPWQDQDMNTYPDQMAAPLLVQAKMRQAPSRWKSDGIWIGDPNAMVVLALPDEKCVNVDHLAWVFGNLRKSGDRHLRNAAVVSSGCPPPDNMPYVVALGRRATEWCEMSGWTVQGVVKHRIDEHHYDDSPPRWMAALVDSLPGPSTNEHTVMAQLETLG